MPTCGIHHDNRHSSQRPKFIITTDIHHNERNHHEPGPCVAALVFLEHYLAGFAAQHPDYGEGKWTGSLVKTWRKRSPAARDFALGGKLHLPEGLAPLVLKAVS